MPNFNPLTRNITRWVRCSTGRSWPGIDLKKIMQSPFEKLYTRLKKKSLTYHHGKFPAVFFDAAFVHWFAWISVGAQAILVQGLDRIRQRRGHLSNNSKKETSWSWSLWQLTDWGESLSWQHDITFLWPTQVYLLLIHYYYYYYYYYHYYYYGSKT